MKSDFLKAIQSAYDQASLCAAELIEHRHHWFKRDGADLNFDTPFRKVLLVCVVSDHYPALAFQCANLLKYSSSELISPPFIMDVFTLDVITEMLDTPIYCLDYLFKRTALFSRISISHQLAALAYHLTSNLWFDDKVDHVHLGDVLESLDVALAVRRQGMHGKATPEGIITKYNDKAIGRLIRHFNYSKIPPQRSLHFCCCH